MRTLLAFAGGFALAHIYHIFVSGGVLSLHNSEFGIGPSSIRGDFYQTINEDIDDDGSSDTGKSSGNVNNDNVDDEEAIREATNDIDSEDHKNGVDVDVGAGIVVKHKDSLEEDISSENIQKSNNATSNETENAENNHKSDSSDSNNTISNGNGNGNSSITKEPESICDALQHQSPMKIWKDHLNPIFHASRHFSDLKDQYIWHDFTAKLLNYMTPQRLATSVKALPFRQWDQVEHILKVVWERYAYLKNLEAANAATRTSKTAKAPPPRKLNILVMGGSVTMGVICSTNPVEKTSRFGRRSCAWPTRLEQFLNSISPFPGAMVQVHVLTLGGTNTKSATTIWDYNLFPKDMPHPDIVIHGYATNDMHVSTVRDAMSRNVTLEDLILEMNQKFIRQVLKPSINVEDYCHRPTPLLLYYDDYIGNEQKEILSTNSFTQAISTLSSYYGLGSMSYANAVKHLTYGDWTEDWFSPNAWPDRQIHPGMGMHISSMWVVAFNFLNTASAFCERLIPEVEKVTEKDNTDNDTQDMVVDVHAHDNNHTLPLSYIASHGLPALKDPDKILVGAPIRVPPDGSIPPELTMNLTLDNISSQWHKDANSAMKFSASQCNEHKHSHGKSGEYVYRPCIFSWIGNMERSFDKVQHMNTRIKPFLVTNSDTGGWEADMDYGKLGYATNKEKAMFELKFENITQTVKTLNFMVMTSYGEKWDGSKVLVEAFVDVNTKGDGKVASLPIAEPRATMEISGQHEKETSETYNHKLVFEDGLEAQVANTLRIRVKLVGGSTFKFMGMAFCDH